MRRSVLALGIVIGVLAMPADAAPVPKSLKRTKPITLTLFQYEKHPDLFNLTVSNHMDTPLTWWSTTAPLAAFMLELTDESGEVVPTVHPCHRRSSFAPPAEETVVNAGKGYFMEFRLSELLNDQPRPEGKLKLTVKFELDGTTYSSDPLEVK